MNDPMEGLELENQEKLNHESRISLRGRSGIVHDFDGRINGMLFRHYDAIKFADMREYRRALDDCCEDGIVRTYDHRRENLEGLAGIARRANLMVAFVDKDGQTCIHNPISEEYC
jgi:hypothetical protein